MADELKELRVVYEMITDQIGAVHLEGDSKNIVDLVFNSNITSEEKFRIVKAAGEEFVRILGERCKAEGVDPKIERNY